MTDNSFAVLASDLRRVRRFDDGAATSPLAAGEVRLRVGPFALTSNNVTYGVFGRSMNYFAFYPAPGAEEGRIPVWGFAEIVESTVPELALGDRFYGYYPPSSHAILRPARPSAAGFMEGAEHRRSLPGIYNQYAAARHDPGYARDREGEIAIFRPLFATAFLLDDFFADQGFLDAEAVVLASASSKTAYTTAFFLSGRRGSGGPRVVGLTSRKSRPFVERLGCYDEVVEYDAVESLRVVPTIFIDMGGDARVRHRVHAHLRDALRHSAIVGATHWDAGAADSPLPGVAPEFFFAPAQAQKRTADWTGEGLRQRIGASWGGFLDRVLDASNPWIRVVRGAGLDAVVQTYSALLDGKVPPDEGHVLTI